MSIIEGIIDGGSGGGGGPTTPPIGSIGLGRWTFNSSGSPASAGQISFDPLALYISTVNADGVDATNFIESTIGTGSIIYVQSNENPDRGFSVKALSVTISPGLATVPIDDIIETPTGLGNGEKLGLTISQGYSTPGNIVTLINTALGQNFWQQGISNAVFVNDFSAASADLAPYLATSGPNSGKWELGTLSSVGTSLIVVNTDRNSLASVMEREIAKQGELQIVSSTPSEAKGMSMTTGVGDASMTSMISSDTGGRLTVECVMQSDDLTRGAFNIQQADGFFFGGVGWALVNPGFVNSRTTDIDCNFIFLQQSYFVVGDQCQFFNCKEFETDAPFLSSQVGFDLTTPCVFGPRTLRIEGVAANSGTTAGQAAFLIDEDNGDNIGSFKGRQNIDPIGNRYILAQNDADFNANPQKSLNLEFDVENFVKTRRIAELGILSPPPAPSTVGQIVIGAGDTFTDMVGPTYILDDSSTSGFDVDPSTGAIIYKLNTPATLKIKYIISGYKISNGVGDYSFTPLYKPAGGVYERITVDDGTNSAFVETFDEFTPGVDPNSTALNFTQRVQNVDDEIKIQIANFTDADNFKPTSVQMVVEI